ncbi:carboxyl transferase domain-containing protein [Streptomyces zhihengii]
MPTDGGRPYDMREVIAEIVDDGDCMEVHERWATSVITTLARLDGQVVGIVASQPRSFAGVLDIHSSEKAARFVQMCDAFNIPIVTLVDVPGFLPGVDQEHGGIIRHGAKLLYAYCNATVPRISLILRKAYGGAYIVMDSQSIGADLTYAWPTNEIAVMGAEGAANVIFRRQIADAEDSEAMRTRMVKEYKAELMHPYYAAERGLVDDVIDPAETREVLIRSLAMLRTKHADLPSRKHGNPRSDESRGATCGNRQRTAPAARDEGDREPLELAAVTAVLMARAGARGTPERQPGRPAGRRPLPAPRSSPPTPGRAGPEDRAPGGPRRASPGGDRTPGPRGEPDPVTGSGSAGRRRTASGDTVE